MTGCGIDMEGNPLKVRPRKQKESPLKKSRKKSLVGWGNLAWESFFYWRFPINQKLTKQNVNTLAMPFITNPCTKKIDGRSHNKIKLRITLEEI